ncbi:15351_t:CDS:2 [Cetraspora pellucida]|uniref:15351_t:CDS:1 n=1 Tax=Cetraspora pellucida TaxID=1433469 RepID=A0ACA9L6M7_9GLOM|nr:15351_t:CDS:2 [Cetraspora pellucida]
MAHICKICKKEFKTSQGYGNHIKSLEHKLKPLNDITNNYTSRQIQFNNEQKNFMEIYSTSNEENKNSNLDLSIYSSSNSSNGIIITDNEELVSNINKNFINVVDKYNISNKAGDAFLKVFKKYSSWNLVSTYNNTNYYFENRSIILAIQELIQNDDLMQQCEFNYKEHWEIDSNNQRV